MGIQTASYFADQLSLDFNEGLLTSDVAANAPSRQMKSILFPKNTAFWPFPAASHSAICAAGDGG